MYILRSAPLFVHPAAISHPLHLMMSQFFGREIDHARSIPSDSSDYDASSSFPTLTFRPPQFHPFPPFQFCRPCFRQPPLSLPLSLLLPPDHTLLRCPKFVCLSPLRITCSHSLLTDARPQIAKKLEEEVRLCVCVCARVHFRQVTVFIQERIRLQGQKVSDTLTDLSVTHR